MMKRGTLLVSFLHVFSQPTLEAHLYDGLRSPPNLATPSSLLAIQRFVDTATDLGTSLFAFIKAQVLQARRSREGSAEAAAKVHRRASNADAATAVVNANLGPGGCGGGGGGAATGADGDGDDGGSSATGASAQSWAKLSCLTYTRYLTSEKMSFPAGMVVLMKALSGVLNHCVGTGDLAVRTYRNFRRLETASRHVMPGDFLPLLLYRVGLAEQIYVIFAIYVDAPGRCLPTPRYG